jgi:RNA polymerase sigma-70 factor (ECF subfamily)
MRNSEATEGGHQTLDLDALYVEEGPRLWRALFAYARDPDIASDSLAEGFAQLIRRGEGVRDPRAWVWRVAFRIAAGELKDRRTREASMRDVGYEMPTETGELVSALSRLPSRQSAVLILRHYAGYRTDEIATILGMSRATVRVHMSRGRRRLATFLEDGDDD